MILETGKQVRPGDHDELVVMARVLVTAFVVLALVGVLLFFTREGVDVSKVVPAQADVEQLKNQLLEYAAENGCLPSMEQGLQALVERPGGEPQPLQWRQLRSSLPADPLGSAYRYETPATKGKDAFNVFSCGKDKLPGTWDEIGNW